MFVELTERNRQLYDAVLIAMQVVPYLNEANDWLLDEVIEEPEAFPLIRIWDLTELQHRAFREAQLGMIRATIQQFNLELEELGYEKVSCLPTHRWFKAVLHGRLSRTLEGMQNE